MSAVNSELADAFWITKVEVELLVGLARVLVDRVTVLPSSEIEELPIDWLPVNLVSLLAVPEPTMVELPVPQLPSVVQIS